MQDVFVFDIVRSDSGFVGFQGSCLMAPVGVWNSMLAVGMLEAVTVIPSDGRIINGIVPVDLLPYERSV